MSSARMLNAKRNAITGLMGKCVVLALPFVIRSIIIRKLGANYTGLDSLFTSVLQVLNLVELGFSSAVTFCLYKPLADGDDALICAYLSFFRKIYKWMGVIIFAVGICLIPVLPFLIKSGYPEEMNIYYLFVIHLVNTAISYWLWGYKTVLLEATQKQSVLNITHMFVSLVRGGVQIAILLVLKNYYLYTGMLLLGTIVNNIVVHVATKKMYPQFMGKGQLDEANKGELKKQVYGVAISRIATTCRNAFDSIFLSAYLGLVSVAVYNNYYYIFNMIFTFAMVLLNAVAAGLGDYVAREDTDANYRLFGRLSFGFGWVGSWATVCLICLYQDAMTIWVGKDYLATIFTMCLFGVYFYVNQIGMVRSVYARAYGIWWQTKHIAVLEAVLNICMNAVLGYFFGMNGILFATIITVFVFSFAWNGKVVMNECFKRSSLDYFMRYLFDAVKTVGVAVLSYWICSFICINPYANLFIKLGICIAVPNILFGVISLINPKERESLFYYLGRVKGKIKRS